MTVEFCCQDSCCIPCLEECDQRCPPYPMKEDCLLREGWDVISIQPAYDDIYQATFQQRRLSCKEQALGSISYILAAPIIFSLSTLGAVTCTCAGIADCCYLTYCLGDQIGGHVIGSAIYNAHYNPSPIQQRMNFSAALTMDEYAMDHREAILERRHRTIKDYTNCSDDSIPIRCIRKMCSFNEQLCTHCTPCACVCPETKTFNFNLGSHDFYAVWKRASGPIKLSTPLFEDHGGNLRKRQTESQPNLRTSTQENELLLSRQRHQKAVYQSRVRPEPPIKRALSSRGPSSREVNPNQLPQTISFLPSITSLEARTTRPEVDRRDNTERVPETLPFLPSIASLEARTTQPELDRRDNTERVPETLPFLPSIDSLEEQSG